MLLKVPWKRNVAKNNKKQKKTFD